MLTASIISQISSKTALVHHPNYRSSHSLPTPRGGGIGIWLAFVIIGFFFFKDKAFTLIAGIAGLIGFLEDIFTLSSKLRLLIQIIISALIVWLFLMMPLSMITVLLFIFWIVFITGTANLYNFMDGINGIAGFTGIVGFGLIAYFSYYILMCFGAIAVAAYQKGLVIQLILLISFSIVFLVSYNLVKMMKPRLSER